MKSSKRKKQHKRKKDRLPKVRKAEPSLSPLSANVRLRLPWLCLLFIFGLAVSGVVGMFEAVVTDLSAVVSFQSLILAMAGNVGTQSLSVTIRAMRGHESQRGWCARLLLSEARIGASVGGILGLISFFLVGGYLYYIKGNEPSVSLSVSFCTGVALFISMLISSILGTGVPMTFKRLGIDPAVASGPIITTLSDLVAVITYYGLAWMMLRYVM